MFDDLKTINFLPNSLVNNAARNPDFKKIKNNAETRLENFSIEEFRLDMEISLIGSFLCSKYLYING